MATRTPNKPITLADLSDQDRKALLREAKEEATRNPTDVPGYDELSDPERAFRALMDGRDHARECPVAEGKILGRVEGYDARKPPRPDLGQPEKYLAVLRCIECGGTTVLDGTGGRQESNLERAVTAKLEELLEPAGVVEGEPNDQEL